MSSDAEYFIWEWTHKTDQDKKTNSEGTWLPFELSISEQLEESHLNNIPHVTINSTLSADLNYNITLNTKKNQVRHSIRRKALALEILSPITGHPHPLFLKKELNPEKCVICMNISKYIYGCKECEDYKLCFACTYEYPPHDFVLDKGFFKMTKTCMSCCKGLGMTWNKCKWCGFKVHMECVVEVQRLTRCIWYLLDDRDKLVTISNRLPKRVKMPTAKYFLFWKKTGKGFYLFGEAYGQYSLVRVQQDSILWIRDLKSFKEETVGPFSIWEAFCKSYIVLRLSVETTADELISALSILPADFIRNRNKIVAQLSYLSNVEIYSRAGRSNFKHCQTNSIRAIMYGLAVQTSSSNITPTLMDLNQWPQSKNDPIIPTALMSEISPENIEIISKCITDITYSRFAILQFWEAVFFDYFIGLIPLPGLKLFYSVIRLIFYSWKRDKAQIISSIVGMLSGVLSFIGLFGIEGSLIKLILNTSESLRLVLNQITGAVHTLGDILSPFKDLITQIDDTAIIRGIIDKTMEKVGDSVGKWSDFVMQDQQILLSSVENCINIYNSLAYGIACIPIPHSIFGIAQSKLEYQKTEIKKLPITCTLWEYQRLCPNGNSCPFEHKILLTSNSTQISRSFSTPYLESEFTVKKDLADKFFQGYEYITAIELYTEMLMNYQPCLTVEILANILERRSDCYFYLYKMEESNLDTKVKEQLLFDAKSVTFSFTHQPLKKERKSVDKRREKLLRSVSGNDQQVVNINQEEPADEVTSAEKDNLPALPPPPNTLMNIPENSNPEERAVQPFMNFPHSRSTPVPPIVKSNSLTYADNFSRRQAVQPSLANSADQGPDTQSLMNIPVIPTVMNFPQRNPSPLKGAQPSMNVPTVMNFPQRNPSPIKGVQPSIQPPTIMNFPQRNPSPIKVAQPSMNVPLVQPPTITNFPQRPVQPPMNIPPRPNEPPTVANYPVRPVRPSTDIPMIGTRNPVVINNPQINSDTNQKKPQ